MNQKHLFFTVLLMVSVILSGCGPSAEQVAAMTAAAWTPTPTPTAIPPTPTQALGIVPTQVSPKDGMTMVYVPAGEFLMGSIDGVGRDDEHPQHTVYLDAYWIDKTEVTNAMFSAFVNDTSYQTDAEIAGSVVTTINGMEITSFDWTWQHPQGGDSNLSGLEEYPVLHVSWNDAVAYCEWAGRRLPTEAEWEKAARGTAGQTYPWGNASPAGNLVNFADSNSSFDWADKTVNDGYENTAPVGSYPDGKSPYGALDMAGNVSEWVADLYGDYPSGSVTNPLGSSSGEYRVLRGGSYGGSWYSSSNDVRSAYRDPATPLLYDFNLGFRCALSP